VRMREGRCQTLEVNPSLPWNHQEPLREPAFPQVTADREGQSYRFSFGEVMRSPSSHALAVSAQSQIPSRDHEPAPVPTAASRGVVELMVSS
jgi:hypothetical protein